MAITEPSSLQPYTPFQREALALEVALRVGLADAASLAVACPAIMEALRCSSSWATSICPNATANKGVVDLVCCILGIAARSGQAGVRSVERPDGKSVLTLAAAAGRPDVVRWLLHMPGCASLMHLPDRSGVYPLHYAALEGHHHVIEVLLECMADANCSDSTGMRPLHLAAEGGHLDACKALLDGRADANVHDAEGVTPLLLTVEEKHLEICSLLVSWRANPLASSNHGRTPLAVARETSNQELLCAMEAAMWPQERRRQHLTVGPEALELMRHYARLR